MLAAMAPLVGDDVARDAEQPDAKRRCAIAVRGTRALLEPMQVGERAEECSLRGVLRRVVIAELVERVVVHLREIPSVQGIELLGIATGRLDETAIAIEVRDPRSSKHRMSHFVTPSLRRAPGGRAEFRR